LITSEVALEEDYIKKHYDAILKEMGEGSVEQACLALYITIEKKNPNSKYKNYFDTMPATYDDFPVMFSDETLKLVQGTNL
jgi:hypothetical protein